MPPFSGTVASTMTVPIGRSGHELNGARRKAAEADGRNGRRQQLHLAGLGVRRAYGEGGVGVGKWRGQIDAADTAIQGVGDQQAAATGQQQTERAIESGAGGRAIVALNSAIARWGRTSRPPRHRRGTRISMRAGPVSGYGRDPSRGGIDPPDPSGAIGEEEIAIRGDGQRECSTDSSGWWRARRRR